MVIDLKRCNGCNACVLACKQEHFLPPHIFRCRVLTEESGTFPNVKKALIPIQCNQCREPVCVEACPTKATYRREDGIVVVDQDKCTGCQHCVTLCPYQERTCYYGEQKGYYPGQGRTALEEEGEQLYPYQDGTVMKCNFCIERIEEGLRRGLTPGVDREATPACVNTCMCKARVFGDLDDPDSPVSRLLAERKHYCLHPEFETDPSVIYLE